MNDFNCIFICVQLLTSSDTTPECPDTGKWQWLAIVRTGANVTKLRRLSPADYRSSRRKEH